MSRKMLERPLRAALLRLRSAGMLGQGMRYALSGSAVAATSLLTTTVLATFVGVPFQVALAIGSVSAITLHFTLQRLFVWTNSHGFALPLRHQLRRYLLVAALQYLFTVLSTSVLPGLLALPVLAVYLATVAIAVSINFTVLRHGIFHPLDGHPDEEDPVVE